MRKITLEALQVLEAINRCGTFALAAKELHKVPSALTYTVNNLEQQLNATLFDRSGHRAKLTAIGELLLKEGQKLLISAEQLEKRIELQQKGYEEQLLIAYDQLIPFHNLIFLIEDFYQACPEIGLKVTGEVLGGCWDALLSHRATLAIGVTGETPLRDDIAMLPLGPIEFAFLVGKHHPLANHQQTLTNNEISTYRSIAVADSTRGLTTRSSGILPGQSILTVNTMQEKIDAMIAGLGIGYLPLTQAKPYIKSGELIEKNVQRLKTKGIVSLAWRPSLIGKAGLWFIEQLSNKTIANRILKMSNFD
ncbi:LysR substrate-binding domain-containing protein [Candidatus Berkiella aquae]|uniref:HTH-type transcriptional activator AllS n=1 Tax=Candidatus Berkiella aquae TaxID=295108 RepID=A0A0Q9YPI6_9GAMM|nr:LysR family transcriptional regulator [Candidatus Berkiella aquae]MCS5711913.1 LysR family transcriptional regulator [Candidatus Berkiella aquae]